MDNNVVLFPSKISPQIENIAQNMIKGAIKIAHESGYNIADNADCMLDLELMYEMMIGTLYRYKNLKHPIQIVMDEVTGVAQETE